MAGKPARRLEYVERRARKGGGEPDSPEEERTKVFPRKIITRPSRVKIGAWGAGGFI